MWRLIETVTIAAGVVCLAASSSAAASSPDPCRLVPIAAIEAAFGTVPSGKRTTQPATGSKLTVCVYERGTRKLEVSVGPAVIDDGGSGGPATVSKPDPTFGSRGHLAYDTSAPFIYAIVSFVKGAYYGSVWSNTVPAAGVVALATDLYKQL